MSAIKGVRVAYYMDPSVLRSNFLKLQIICHIMQIARGGKVLQLKKWAVIHWKAFAVIWQSYVAKSYCTMGIIANSLEIMCLPTEPQNFSTLNDLCSNDLKYMVQLLPLQLPVTTKKRDNVAAISHLLLTDSHAVMLFVYCLRGRDLAIDSKQGFYGKQNLS